MRRIEVMSDRPDQLGEGPLWDAAEQRLHWIDSHGPAVHSTDPTGADRRSWKLPEPIGSMAPREKGGAIPSLRDGFHGFDFAVHGPWVRGLPEPRFKS
jgi:sugar lactone lactonase YvrE